MARRPTSRDLDSLTKTTTHSLARVVNSLADGRTDADAFADKMESALSRAHARAGYLGRRRAGDFSTFGDADRSYGDSVAGTERQYINTFAEDIKGGRYTDAEGNLDAEAIQARADLYAERLRGTANESFAGTSDADAMFEWHLGIVRESHCGDCPSIASGSPYRADSIPTLPGMNQTACLFRCNCSVRRVADNLDGF